MNLSDNELPVLDESERKIYEWQMWTPDLAEAGQRKLKNATVLVSRVGGVGGNVALQLAAAGVGTLIIAHGGDLRYSDLNRQILMSHAGLGSPRVAQAAARLRQHNPSVRVIEVAENLNEANATALVEQADVVVDAAPLFEERFAMNAAAFRLGRPIVETAMFDLSLQVTTMQAGRSPCLRCLHPEPPPHWKRQFPVIGATAATAGAIAAVEAIKLICGIGDPLFGRMLLMDLRNMSTRFLKTAARTDCLVCGIKRGDAGGTRSG